ncbi:type III-A CRISPR-associated protein Csm2 [bacterium]|nr:type III-A CRISPR-associated protein Csm2 [bacterium]
MNDNNNRNNNFKDNFSLDIEKIFNVLNTNDYSAFIQESENFAKKLSEEKKNKIKTSQLRKFYDEIIDDKLSKENYRKTLPFLKVKLAYAKGRKTINDLFYSNMIKLIDKSLEKEENIEIFKDFFESIIAYYKFYGDDK